jgi:ribosomal protein S18 acetylase RimI-like enzyme
MQIRKYQSKDKENCREVCHKTATAPKYVKSKDLVCLLYCDYYLDNEPNNCFVVADDDDNAVGYILSAEDQKQYDKAVRPYLKKARKIDFVDGLMPVFESIAFKSLCKKYPAHLHIDILPIAQGQGYGSELVKALEAHLKSKGIKGVRLGVGGDNFGAHRFYERNGFILLKNLGSMGRVYGKEL